MRSLPRPSGPRAGTFATLVVLAGLLAVYAAVTFGSLGGAGVQDAVGRWVYDARRARRGAVVLARAVRVERERGAWLCLGFGLLFWALGQTYYSVVLYYASPAPFPSPADALFLAFYPATYLAWCILLRAARRHVDAVRVGRLA